MPEHKILVLPGDHVGPEVIAEAIKVLDAVSERFDIKFLYEYELFGGASIDVHGTAITDSVIEKAKASDSVLFGSVGGPKWGAAKVRPEEGVLRLRKELDCWANIRPCRFPSDKLVKLSVIKEDIIRGTDFIVLRENCGGAYFGPKVETDEFASDSWQYSKPEIERISLMAAYLARTQYPDNPVVFSLDKANVLAVSRLWRRVVTDVFKTEFPDVKLVHQLADSAAMIMINKPTSLNGVLLCDNTFGDILSDEAAVITGSLGLLPSASLSAVPANSNFRPGLYEPSHGSAPDLPRNAVNPIATILSAQMMLRYSLNEGAAADSIEAAVKGVIDSGIVTRDIGGTATTSDVGDAIAAWIRSDKTQ